MEMLPDITTGGLILCAWLLVLFGSTSATAAEPSRKGARMGPASMDTVAKTDWSWRRATRPMGRAAETLTVPEKLSRPGNRLFALRYLDTCSPEPRLTIAVSCRVPSLLMRLMMQLWAAAPVVSNEPLAMATPVLT